MENGSTITDNIRRLASEMGYSSSERASSPTTAELAEALGWTRGEAHTERVDNATDVPAQLLRGMVGDQPAVLFVSEEESDTQSLITLQSSGG